VPASEESRARATAFPLGAAVTVAALDGDPHPVLARLREREPVSWLPALDGWLITRRDLALAAMRDAEAFTVDDPRFTTGRVIGPSMLSRDGAEHARHREPFARPFRLAPVRERFAATVAAEVDRLLAALEPEGRGDLRTRLAGPLAAATTADALGLHGVDSARILEWYRAIVAAVTAVTAGAPLPDAGRAGFEALRAAVEPELGRDPLSSLVAAAASMRAGKSRLERHEVVSNAAVLLFGGIETTEGMIANALAHLLGDREQLERALATPDGLAAAVEESLRLEPAAATVDRYATRDVAFGGADIRERELVTISIAAANRDPAAFEAPDRFDVTRSDARRHVAFAAGPHVCIGMHLARLEAHTALDRVFARLPGLRLDPAHPPPAPRGLVFRKPDAVRAIWDGGPRRT
jgi:cytochrome P450